MLAAAWATISCLLASGLQLAAAQGYVVPKPKISVLSPRGIRFEISGPNAGVSLIAYHYSINTPVPGLEPGQWNFDVFPQGGNFVHENQLVPVNNGDKVYYWVYAIYNGLGYHLLDQQWTYIVITTPLSPQSSSMTTLAVSSAPPLSRSSSAVASKVSTTSTGIVTAWSMRVVPVSDATPAAGVTEGFSTRDAIILGVVLGVAAILVAILSTVLILRSKRRNSMRPPSGNSSPPRDKLPEALLARPTSVDQSHVYDYVEEAYNRGPERRLPAESPWPEAALTTGPHPGTRPPPPLPPGAVRASATPGPENYYIQLIKE